MPPCSSPVTWRNKKAKEATDKDKAEKEKEADGKKAKEAANKDKAKADADGKK